MNTGNSPESRAIDSTHALVSQSSSQQAKDEDMIQTTQHNSHEEKQKSNKQTDHDEHQNVLPPELVKPTIIKSLLFSGYIRQNCAINFPSES